MSDYTPTTEEVSAACSRYMSSEDFDRWLAAHDAEVRAEGDPSKDERLVRYMAMVTPLGYQSALTVVQQMTLMIQAETEVRRAGVVAEEPKLEYGVRHRLASSVTKKANLKAAEVCARVVTESSGIEIEAVQRVAAGPWVPVKHEGADQ